MTLINSDEPEEVLVVKKVGLFAVSLNLFSYDHVVNLA